MSYSMNYPGQDSSTSVVKAYNVPSLIWGSDWAVQNVDVPNGVRLSNLTAPTDFEQKVQYETRERANVYAGSTVDRVYWAASLKGKTIIVDFRDTPYLTNSGDATFLQAFPIKMRAEITFPSNQYVDETVLAREFMRFLACFSESDETGVAQFFKRHMRGASTPSDL